MKRIVALIAFAIALSAATAPATIHAPIGPHSRAEAVSIIADLRKIVSPQGLQAIETVPIGGIRQVVSIRSQDLRNPVLVYFHGGPGFVEMPLDCGGTAAGTNISLLFIGTSATLARHIA
ncbi:hypothetical protein [Sphingobium sp. SCG-1]|uniref:hypothetical protein n=1 Tax=Sphingobium sp. SCG-1 TaxID=2072936 RepID=UPI001CB92865|nr:hypothetical protein [Sphingobium sp. SCG-1]